MYKLRAVVSRLIEFDLVVEQNKIRALHKLPGLFVGVAAHSIHTRLAFYKVNLKHLRIFETPTFPKNSNLLVSIQANQTLLFKDLIWLVLLVKALKVFLCTIVCFEHYYTRNTINLLLQVHLIVYNVKIQFAV